MQDDKPPTHSGINIEARRIQPHRANDMSWGMILFFLVSGSLGLLFFIGAADSVHKSRHASPTHSASTHATANDGNYAQAAAKAKRAIMLREAHDEAHPYPIKHWWVYAFSTYQCVRADTLPSGLQTPMQARIWMRLHGDAGRLQVLGREGDGDGISVVVHTTNNLSSKGFDYFSSHSGCQMMNIATKLHDGVLGSVKQIGGD